MQYTAGALARLAGLSTRTLRWYDQIGLLRPTRTQSGYRQYGPAEVDRLQQILFYRQAGVELSTIRDILDAPGFDAAAALEEHLSRMKTERARLSALIDTAESTLLNMKGTKTMSDKEKFEGFKKKLIDENEEKYGAEVRQRWGDEAADKSNAKMMKMTEEQYAAFEKLGERLNAALAEAVKTGDPAGPAGQQAAALHKEWLCFTWPQYNAEAHKNLAQMYVDDERFAQYYEKIAPGAATFLRDAVAIMVDGQ